MFCFLPLLYGRLTMSSTTFFFIIPILVFIHRCPNPSTPRLPLAVRRTTSSDQKESKTIMCIQTRMPSVVHSASPLCESSLPPNDVDVCPCMYLPLFIGTDIGQFTQIIAHLSWLFTVASRALLLYLWERVGFRGSDLVMDGRSSHWSI